LIARQQTDALTVADRERQIQKLLLRSDQEQLKELANSKELEKVQYERNEAVFKKDKVLRTSELAKERSNRNMLALGFLSIFAISGFSVYHFNQRKKLSFQKQVSETEMKALRAQMNPHFIFNSLNSIHSFIQNHEHDQAAVYLMNFAKLTRTVLENSMHQLIPLQEELDALKLYLDLEALRFGKQLEYTIDLDPAIDPEQTLIAPLILQPFLENAILHGLRHKQGGGHILIHIRRNGSLMQCVVEDNGVGRRRSQALQNGSDALKRESLGMKLTEQRIAIINKTRKAKASLKVVDVVDGEQSAGVKVELILPFETRF
jgi:LytS/YehU family sensor histidine kinase